MFLKLNSACSPSSTTYKQYTYSRIIFNSVLRPHLAAFGERARQHSDIISSSSNSGTFQLGLHPLLWCFSLSRSRMHVHDEKHAKRTHNHIYLCLYSSLRSLAAHVYVLFISKFMCVLLCNVYLDMALWCIMYILAVFSVYIINIDNNLVCCVAPIESCLPWRARVDSRFCLHTDMHIRTRCVQFHMESEGTANENE